MLTATSNSSVIYNHRGDVMSEYYVDPVDDSITFNKKQDVSKLLKYCHLKREHVPIDRKSNFRPIAEIPNIIYYRAVREGWANDSDAWKKWYSDPDNKYFRTS
tara:strand:- start:192 stop:500 length:309 start_codon:yes stop_codon:yes gene_type:complete